MLCLGLGLLLAASAAQAIEVEISGYIDFGYAAMQGGLDPNGQIRQGWATASTGSNQTVNDGFALNDVYIDVSCQLTENKSLAFGLESALGAAQILDYGYIEFTGLTPCDLTVDVGRVNSVVGIEGPYSDPVTSKFINLSLASPVTVGTIDGVSVAGSWRGKLKYAFSFTNNDNMTYVNALTGFMDTAAPATRAASGLIANSGVSGQATNDNNENKGVMGRLAVAPRENLELGVSGILNVPTLSTAALDAALAAAAGLPRNYRRMGGGCDLAYTHGPFAFRAEYVRLREEALNGLAQIYRNRLVAYYLELGYDVTPRCWTGVRYNRQRLTQHGPGAVWCMLNTGGVVFDVSTVQLASLYRIADNVRFKAEYDWNGEKFLIGLPVSAQQPKCPNNVFALSLVGVF